MKTIMSIAALGLILVAGGVAAADEATQPAPDPQQRQQRAEQMKQRWVQADANQDGRLSREEAQKGMPKLAQHFDKLDADGDGQLTPEELRAVQGARKGDRPTRKPQAQPQ